MNNKDENVKVNETAVEGVVEEVALDDERRVRVLSPGRLVAQRFFRNKLSIAGLICIVAMALFSYGGQLITSYGQSDMFYKMEMREKDYAAATINTRPWIYAAPGVKFSPSAVSMFQSAIAQKLEEFDAEDTNYLIVKESDDLYAAYEGIVLTMVEVPRNAKMETEYTPEVSDEMKRAFEKANKAGAPTFELDGVTYRLTGERGTYYISELRIVALGEVIAYDMYDASKTPSFEFRLEAGRAFAAEETEFLADGVTYTVEYGENLMSIMLNGADYANASNVVVQPYEGAVKLSVAFKERVKEVIAEGGEYFWFADEGGEQAQFAVVRQEGLWTIYRKQDTKVIDKYAEASPEHLFGTDANGMDIITRLMYGGRVSLVIGFVVVIIELVIGVVLGGIAGYFGHWVDNVIMRVVDTMNCIPSLPLLIILGSVMDAMKVNPNERLMYLMAILGLLGWPGTARLVRGQILSLREQEFMVATEATGISVYRRIFRHLVPNVMPQLIVLSTGALGGVILTESALSFLGLGVKFPFASWGNIINSVSDAWVMTNYPLVWVPAGLCLLITVLGFNFIGDGLRDAFDPKMKR